MLGGAGATVAVLDAKPEPIKLVDGKAITWEKPVTDAQWAEDVKKENFDTRKTQALEVMVESHTNKLAKNEKAFEKYKNCLDCIYWEKYYQLKDSYPDMSKAELETEARNATNTDYNQRLWEIEKIQQSVERMDKEIELRDKGFVVVEGEEVTTGLFGGKPYAIRHVTD